MVRMVYVENGSVFLFCKDEKEWVESLPANHSNSYGSLSFS